MHTVRVQPSIRPTLTAGHKALIPYFTIERWDNDFVNTLGWDLDFARRYVTVINDLTPDAALSQQDRTLTAHALRRTVMMPSRKGSQDWYLLLRIAVDSYLRAECWFNTGDYPTATYQMAEFRKTFDTVYKAGMKAHGHSREALIQYTADWIESKRKAIAFRDKPQRVTASDVRGQTDWPNFDMKLDFSGVEERVIAHLIKGRLTGVSTPHSKHDIYSLFIKDTNMNTSALNSVGATTTADRSEEDFHTAYEAARPGTFVGPVVIGYDPANGSAIQSDRVFKPAVVPGNELKLGQTYRLQTLGAGYAPDFVEPGLVVMPLDNGDGFVGEVLVLDGYRVFVTDGTDQYTLHV